MDAWLWEQRLGSTFVEFAGQEEQVLFLRDHMDCECAGA
jgi:hypothetical protein